MVIVELRQKAVEVLLAFTAGAHQTTLLTYLIQRDLFPSIMKVYKHTSAFVVFLFVPEANRDVTTLVHPRLRFGAIHRPTLHPSRPPRQLQQIRVPEPLPTPPQRLRQRGDDTKDHTVCRRYVPEAEGPVCRRPG